MGRAHQLPAAVNSGLASGTDVYLEIAYDAVGRRVLTVENKNVEDPCSDDDPPYPVSTRHVYLGLTPVEEYQQADCPTPTLDVNWELAREFLWGPRFPEPLAMVDWTEAGDVAAGAEEWIYYVQDRLGSVVGLAAAGRQSAGSGGASIAEPRQVERYVYDPYGKTYIERKRSVNPKPVPLGFAPPRAAGPEADQVAAAVAGVTLAIGSSSARRVAGWPAICVSRLRK